MEYNNNSWTKYDDILLEILIKESIDLYEISIILKKTLFEIQSRVIIKQLNKQNYY